MPRYVWKGEGFVDRSTGEPMPVVNRNAVCRPAVIRDIEEYRSPINGLPISSRSHQREDLKRNDCVLAEPRKKPRGYKNAAWAKRRGLPLNLDA